MQAILVKYLGPTNSRPSRYKASCQAGSITISKSYGRNDAADAALALCTKLGWEGDLIEGGLPNGDAVFVFAETFSGDKVKNPYRDPRRGDGT